MNAEPLDIYLATLDAAEREHFPPCCAECRFYNDEWCQFHKEEENGYVIHVYSDSFCTHYEPKSPSDGLEDIY